jgi:hypothetical protein
VNISKEQDRKCLFLDEINRRNWVYLNANELLIAKMFLQTENPSASTGCYWLRIGHIIGLL